MISILIALMFKNTFLKSLILILFAALFFGIKGEASATSLAPWDIFVVTVNSNPDMVEFVSRVNMITGTKIYLSDDGRTSTGAWRNTEWYITFISSVLIPRGTIIRLTWLELASQFVFPSWAWTVTKNGTFDLATIWENILMYQWTTYNQVSPSFLYWLWFWSGTTWISTWTPTSNNSYLPSPLIFGQNALSLSSNRNIQYNCSNTALLDPSFVTAIHSASNRNSGTVAYTGSTCVFDFINPSLSINLATWQSLLTSGHLVKFFVSASEALNTGSFTCADIVLSGSFVGSSACNSIVQVSPFDRTKFEITVLATGNGVINMNILSWTVQDVAWNSNSPSTVISNTITIDQAKPVVTLISGNITLAIWSPFSDPGATWTDNSDWSWVILTATSWMVNTAVIGTYILEYTYTDTAGNTGNIVTRTVNVTDQTAPVVVLSGGNTITIAQWWTYTEEWATRTDNIDWSWIIFTSTSWTVDTNTVGTYILEYTYTDTAGNTGNIVTRTVNVTDQTPPVVTLSGTDLTLNWWDTYTEEWATRTDNIDWSWIILTPTSGTVNSNPWTYILEYTYTDTAGNTGNTVTRTVNVIDQTSPIITLSWSSTITLNQWSGFIDSGASCIDDIDGILAVNISWTVNTSITGTYLMVYSCTDTAWNTSSVTRTVNVIASSIVVPVTPTTPNWSTYNPNAGNTNNNPNTNTQTNSTENSTPATGLDTSIFNTDIDTNTCFVPMDKLTVDQGNNVSALFKIAHQMLYSYGLTTIAGTKDFAPTRQITRAEAAKFFVQFAQNVLCKKTIQSYDNRFVDIAGIHPDLQANIKLSYEYGIFYGAEGGKFNPDAYISHDELVAVIIRLVTGKYDDASGTDRAANYINTLETHTSIDLTNTTRGKLAEVLYDLYKNNNYSLGDSGYVLD